MCLSPQIPPFTMVVGSPYDEGAYITWLKSAFDEPVHNVYLSEFGEGFCWSSRGFTAAVEFFFASSWTL